MNEFNDTFAERETDVAALRRPFDAAYVRRHLAVTTMPHILYFETTPSTQDEARAFVRNAAQYAISSLVAVVVADEQVAGRGRLGRVWRAPAAAGLLATYIVRRRVPLDQAFWITAALGLAVRDEVAAWLNGAGVAVECRLKWPNDVLLDGRKLAGLLVETMDDGAGGGWLLLGCGLNVSLTPDELNEAGVGDSATSMWNMLLARPAECDDDACVSISHAQRTLLTYKLREKMLLGIIARFEASLAALEADPYGLDVLRARWAAALATLGQRVRVTPGLGRDGQSYEADAQAVADDGGLIVRRTDTSTTLTVQAGDVSLRRPDGGYGV